MMENGYYTVGMDVPEYKDWNEDLKVKYSVSPIPDILQVRKWNCFCVANFIQ